VENCQLSKGKIYVKIFYELRQTFHLDRNEESAQASYYEAVLVSRNANKPSNAALEVVNKNETYYEIVIIMLFLVIIGKDLAGSAGDECK
jgi:hypothetical protein